MDSQLWARVRATFERLLDVPEAERAAWVERECAGDAALRSRLVRLLEADSSGSLGLRAAPSLEGLLDGPNTGLTPGTVLGPFVLVEPIAVGGMGTVWLAEQAQPRRRVALKTLRAEISGPEAQKRFRAEAELLAHLSHPGIAQVYGAGTAWLDGRPVPYIAMEYVEGSHGLVEWCESQGLDTRARLRVFVAACEAVHHGHVRGVIHRDLKPNNVLVDPAGHPKVIDFGLARALDAEGLDVSVAHTRAGDILGTLAYMSPEHVGGKAFAVDARSDVYALGCILCELVTGRPPIAVDGLPLTEVARRIAEQPPEIAGTRPVDLRWVLNKALEKQPERRYPSASELAADVQRVLDGRPIEARPPSTFYELGKLMRRHRALLAAVSAVVLALSVGLVLAQREARAAERARTQAQREAILARTTSQFLNDVFQSASVYDRGREARVSDAISYAESRLDHVADPIARAVLASVVGRAWMRLEDTARGKLLLDGAIDELRRSLPSDDFFRMQAEVVLADLLELEQRFEESRQLSLSVLPVLEASLGGDHALSHYLRLNLAICELRLGNAERAEGLLRADLERYEARGDAEGTRAARRDLHHHLGNCRMDQGDPEGALEELDLALALAHEAPFQQATLHTDLGRAWIQLGDLELALEEFDRAEDLYAGLPPSAVHRFALANNRAEALIRLGRLDAASTELDLAQRALEKGWGEPGLRHVLQAEQRARLALAQGRPEQALEVAVTCRELIERIGLSESNYAAAERLTTARILLALGRASEAAAAASACRELSAHLGASDGKRFADAGEVLAQARRIPGELAAD